MFQNSVVSDSDLTQFRERTQLMIDNGDLARSKLKDVIVELQKVPDIATVWSCEGLVRVEKGRPRTRQAHYLSFVVNEKGLKLLEVIWQVWQAGPDGQRMSLTLQHQQYQHRPTATYPAWTFKLNRRPDDDVVEQACEYWLMMAKVMSAQS
ncbi:hypothetical protein pEaSNUABM8_00135 [Erwinia phage pEa_SNUABM_8]|nr:hypothetical protein pEaSNUABM8_00135 [Erwinia phage pEa_SNUABM_8]QVW54887.1 hypothetical protein pEaSNUABM4_00134 [Erwinia phage pEa_SNUABM_4]